MFSPYFMEMTTKEKQDEIARNIQQRSLVRAARPAPSPLRQSVASAVIRFGMFLDSGAYHCPDVATQR